MEQSTKKQKYNTSSPYDRYKSYTKKFPDEFEKLDENVDKIRQCLVELSNDATFFLPVTKNEVSKAIWDLLIHHLIGRHIANIKYKINKILWEKI